MNITSRKQRLSQVSAMWEVQGSRINTIVKNDDGIIGQSFELSPVAPRPKSDEHKTSISHNQRKIKLASETANVKEHGALIKGKEVNTTSQGAANYNNISNIYNISMKDSIEYKESKNIMEQTSLYLSKPPRFGGGPVYSSLPNDRKNTTHRNEELFYSWIGDQWKKYVPVKEYTSSRIQTPKSKTVEERNNPFGNITPKLKKQQKYNKIEATIVQILNDINADMKHGKQRTPTNSLGILSDRSRAAYNCIVNIIPYLAISSKRDANLILQSCDILVESFNKCTMVAKKLVKETTNSDSTLMKTKEFFKNKINEMSKITQARERRSYEHLKQLESHMIQQERDLLELRLQSNSNTKKVKTSAKADQKSDVGNCTDGNESDEDALTSQVYQNLLSEYNMLNGVNKALEKELIRIQDDRDNCISMLSKLVGDGKTTKDLVKSLENRVEKIQAKDISNHVTKKIDLLCKIIALRFTAIDELRLRTYGANQQVNVNFGSHNDYLKTKNKSIQPTLFEFWDVELSTQEMEIQRLQKLCKSTVEQQHPLLEIVNDIFGLENKNKSRNSTLKSKKGKKRGRRNKQWLLKQIYELYDARIKYCSSRTTGNIIDSSVKMFPSFVVSYYLEKYPKSSIALKFINDLLDCVEKFTCNNNKNNEGQDDDLDNNEGGGRYVEIFSEFLSGAMSTSVADFFIFALSLVQDCHFGVRYPILEYYNIPYWISSIAASHILNRLFPKLGEKIKKIIMGEIKNMQSRVSAKEVAIAMGVTESNSYTDSRLPFIAFIDIMLKSFCREKYVLLDKIHQNMQKLDVHNTGYISFSQFRELIRSYSPLIYMNLNLESLFVKESMKIHALVPSVGNNNANKKMDLSKECKIDFTGVCTVLELTGALTLQLGYIIKPPQQTYGGEHGKQAFEMMSRLNTRCMEIFHRLINEMKTTNDKSNNDAVGHIDSNNSVRNNTISILQFRKDCVECEWHAQISPYRLEFAVMRLIHSLHEATFLHQGFTGELAFNFFETSCNKQIELIEQRSGIGKTYLQEVRQKYGVTEAERFSKQIKAFLIIKRRMKHLLKTIRSRRREKKKN